MFQIFTHQYFATIAQMKVTVSSFPFYEDDFFWLQKIQAMPGRQGNPFFIPVGAGFQVLLQCFQLLCLALPRGLRKPLYRFNKQRVRDRLEQIIDGRKSKRL